MMPDMMRFDCHMHTPFCGHAMGTPMEFLRQAKRKGISLMTFTCHVPFDHEDFGGPTIRMPMSDFERYLAWVNQAREMGQGMGIHVLCGIEAEVFPVPGIQEAIAGFLSSQNLDFILGSLHHQLPAYRKYLAAKNRSQDAAIIEGYFDELSQAAASGLFHSLAHPDVIRTYGTVRPFEPKNYETVIRRFLLACAENGTCIEVNTSGLTKGVFKLHPDPLILEWAQEMNVSLTLGSDAHKPQSVGQFFDQTLKLLESTGFKKVHYFVRGGKHAVPVKGMVPAPIPDLNRSKSHSLPPVSVSKRKLAF